MLKIVKNIGTLLVLCTIAGCATTQSVPQQSPQPQVAIADPHLQKHIATALKQTHKKVQKSEVTVLKVNPINEVG